MAREPRASRRSARVPRSDPFRRGQYDPVHRKPLLWRTENAPARRTAQHDDGGRYAALWDRVPVLEELAVQLSMPADAIGNTQSLCSSFRRPMPRLRRRSRRCYARWRGEEATVLSSFYNGRSPAKLAPSPARFVFCTIDSNKFPAGWISRPGDCEGGRRGERDTELEVSRGGRGGRRVPPTPTAGGARPVSVAARESKAARGRRLTQAAA